MVTGD
jgi:magnesium-transporting ATPase (P-type)